MQNLLYLKLSAHRQSVWPVARQPLVITSRADISRRLLRRTDLCSRFLCVGPALPLPASLVRDAGRRSQRSMQIGLSG